MEMIRLPSGTFIDFSKVFALDPTGSNGHCLLKSSGSNHELDALDSAYLMRLIAEWLRHNQPSGHASFYTVASVYGERIKQELLKNSAAGTEDYSIHR